MFEFSRSLGNAVRNARTQLGLTQKKVANEVNIDERTIINIETEKGNPKMVVLYPLLRFLKIDPRKIFYPELKRESPTRRQLRILLEECDEDEAEAILSVVQSVLNLMRKRRSASVHK